LHRLYLLMSARGRSGEGDAVPAAVAEHAETAVPGGGPPHCPASYRGLRPGPRPQVQSQST
jgi:hypothetical protein